MADNAKVVDREMKDEMVGVLTAISIVSKRLANRLMQLDDGKLPDPSEVEVKV